MANLRLRWVTRISWVLLAIGFLAGCSTGEDSNLFSNISTLRILIVDSGIRPQSVTDPEGRYQAVTWAIGPGMATLTLTDGSDPIDFTFSSDCDFTDTTLSAPLSRGTCQDGIIVGARPDSIMGTFQLTITAMDVRRARPIILDPRGDADGDGILNDEDICPLVEDPDQSDDNNDGIGDACSRIDAFTGGLSLDNDLDGFADRLDNCVWIANSDQADSGGLALDGIPDGIGDACTEQLAVVQDMMGNPTLTLERMIEISPESGRASFVTVDIRGLDSLDCDWDGMPCVIDLSQVEVCFNTNAFIAALGCF